MTTSAPVSSGAPGADVRELLCGSVGGAVATVVEFPFDTIKVRLQEDGQRYTGSINCIAEIIRREGFVNGFFRGLPAPVIGAAVENAVLFWSYRAATEMLQDFLYGFRVPHDREPYAVVAGAAGLSGLVVSQILTPVELIKCKMQIQNTLPEASRVYRNSLHCGWSIFRQSGFRGLYHGHVAMLYREMIGCAAYFSTFHWVIRTLQPDIESLNQASMLLHFIGGGCAGVAFWTSSYPIDALKTKQQTHKVGYTHSSFRQGFQLLYKCEGWRGLWRGYPVTAIRAFPGNAVLFTVYEYVSYLYDASTTHRAYSHHHHHLHDAGSSGGSSASGGVGGGGTRTTSTCVGGA